MKNKIDVSVIIPTYNAAETIGNLVNKILSEPRVVIELIIVDDGSTCGPQCGTDQNISFTTGITSSKHYE